MTTTTREQMTAAARLAVKRYLDRQQPVTSTDPVAWITSEFIIPETGGPLPLAPYHIAALQEAHRRVDGKFVYGAILWSDIKKSAKSTIAAAVIAHRAFHTPYGMFRIVANDLRQADSRVFFYLRRAIELNPRLRSQATIKNYRITLSNGAVIEAVPVDPSGEAGGNDDFIEFTELHAASSKAAVKMWAEMTIPPTKHGYGQRWIDTYAGHVGESPILEQLYQMTVNEGRQVHPEYPIYANGDLLALWNTTPRLEWQTPEYYASEERILPPAEFRRMHRNEWVSSENTFIPAEWWAACKGAVPDRAADESVVVGIDAGVTNDCFAVVGVSRRGDMTYVRFAKVWQPKGTPLDFAEPEGYLREVAQRYPVTCFVYDPYQLHDMATRLRREGVGWFRSFAQGQDRLIADKLLYDGIRDRRVMHGGDPVLGEHLLNANQKSEGERLRIVKRAEHLKIDAAVALSMAHAEARRLYVG